jgi:hypothetical protein
VTLRDGLLWWYGPGVRLETWWQGVDKIGRESPLVLWLIAVVPIAWATIGMWVLGRIFRMPEPKTERVARR